MVQFLTYAMIGLMTAGLVWCIYKGVKNNRCFSREERRKSGDRAALAFFVIWAVMAFLERNHVP